jgi:hypothetical protein
MHPYMTAELARQRRASLLGEAGHRRLVRSTAHKQAMSGLTSRLAAMALLVVRATARMLAA